MTDRFTTCISIVDSQAVEGGFVENPSDPGGATNHGITLADLSRWRGHPCTVADVQALTLAEAMAIARAWYWAPIAGDSLGPGVDLMVLDAAYNQGPGRACVWLQASVDVTQDGHVGPATLAALAAATPSTVLQRLHDLRLDAYRADPEWPTFQNGWIGRLGFITVQAQRMLT